MAQLAILGHATRGKEVIEILEMLGGKNLHNYCAECDSLCYYIGKVTKTICYDYVNEDIPVFTLEEFLEKFPYKVGDKVWINDHINDVYTIKSMVWETSLNRAAYRIEAIDGIEDDSYWYADEMLYYVEPKEETMEEKTDKALAPDLRGEDYSDKRFGYKIPNGYEFDCIQNNEIIIKPIKPKYPKTYKECCEVLGFNTMDNDAQGYEAILIIRFQELLIARNAYWEIAGKMMRLGEPWKPDWLNTNTQKHCIYYVGDEIKKQPMLEVHHFLAFPTAKIRDTFYYNFKELIEGCKELL